MPDFNTIQNQTEIQWFMRVPLLDFLLEAHQAFLLHPETLHLTVNLLDRYCSRHIVPKYNYQLVGCIALLIAAKYGGPRERVPTIGDLSLMCCSFYTYGMFTGMENHFVSALDWVVGHPTVACFQKFCLIGKVHDRQLECLSLYLAEVSLYHKEFISIYPSVLARSTLALARDILGLPQPHWSEWAALNNQQVYLSLVHHVKQPSAVLAAKYSAPDHCFVASIVDEFFQRQKVMTQGLMHQVPRSNTLVHLARPTSMQVMAPERPRSTCCICQCLVNRVPAGTPKVNGTSRNSRNTPSRRFYNTYALHTGLRLVCNSCIQRHLGYGTRNSLDTRVVRRERHRSGVFAKQYARWNVSQQRQ
jgi:hypothetical protein